MTPNIAFYTLLVLLYKTKMHLTYTTLATPSSHQDIYHWIPLAASVFPFPPLSSQSPKSPTKGRKKVIFSLSQAGYDCIV